MTSDTVDVPAPETAALIALLSDAGWDRVSTGAAGSRWVHPDGRQVAVVDAMTRRSWEWVPTLERAGFTEAQIDAAAGFVFP